MFFALLFAVKGVNIKAETYTEVVDGVSWTIDSYVGGTVVIKPTDKETVEGSITIPRAVMGYEVTSIDSSAFFKMHKIETSYNF